MTENTSAAYRLLCEEIAEERVNILFPNAPEENKKTLSEAVKTRLFRLYDDFFDAGHINAIVIDTVDEINATAKKKVCEECVRRNTAQTEKPATIIKITGAAPEQVAAILMSHGYLR